MNYKRIQRTIGKLKPSVQIIDGLYYPRIKYLSSEFINLNKNLENALQTPFQSAENALMLAEQIINDIKNYFISYSKHNDIYLKITKRE